MYATINALNRGETIDFQGIMLKKVYGEIAPGDLYVAERNTGPHLLTCRTVDKRGWINPSTMHYAFNTGECVKVEEA